MCFVVLSESEPSGGYSDESINRPVLQKLLIFMKFVVIIIIIITILELRKWHEINFKIFC